MKVSFLVTYYNQAQYVKKSLESILNINKNFDWEILAGDDGSSDETVSEINQFIKKYPDNIKLFIQSREENKNAKSIQRASFNRLNLIEHCSGDYFCIIDGDDFYCNKDFVIKAIDIFNQNSDVSVVAFRYQKLNPDNTTEQVNTIDAVSNSIIRTSDYLRKCYIHSGACVYKNTFLQDKSSVQKLKNIGFYDDADIIMNAFNYGSLYFYDEVVYTYRQTGDGLWSAVDLLDQHFLNVISYDVEYAICTKYKKDLYFRSFVAIFYIWFIRDILEKKLGEQKVLEYDTMIKALNNGNLISYNLLHYKNIPFNKKLTLMADIISFIFSHPKFSVKNLIGVFNWRKNVITG